MSKFIKKEAVKDTFNLAKEGSRRVGSIVAHLARHKKITLGTSTKDPEYEKASEEFLELFRILNEARAQTTKYLSAVRAMCFATSEIGTAFGTVAAGGDDASRAACAEMAAFGRRLDDVVRRSMDERFAEQVVGSLDQIIGDMKAIKTEMDKRAAFKREHDHYYFKVRSLKEKETDDPQKLLRNEEKLTQTEVPMRESTAHLLRIFRSYEDNKHLLIRDAFLAFRSLQQEFSRDVADGFAQLRAQPSTAATTLVPFEPYVYAGPGPRESTGSISSLGTASRAGSFRSSGGFSGGGGGGGASYRDRLVAFYRAYNPAKVPEADDILAKFAGHEERMFAELVRKYGPEPGGRGSNNHGGGGGGAAAAGAAAAAPAPPPPPPSPGNMHPAAAAIAAAGVPRQDSFSRARNPASAAPPLPAPAPPASAAQPQLVKPAPTRANDPGGEPEDPAGANPATASPGTGRARALFDYAAQDTDEVSLAEGMEVEVLEQGEDGWWKGRLPSGQVGLFPGNYVELDAPPPRAASPSPPGNAL